MPSERVQRRIDALLDEVDEAISATRWDEVAQKVLTSEPSQQVMQLLYSSSCRAAIRAAVSRA